MLQQIINTLYRYPKARLKSLRRFGGYLNYRRMLHSRELMKQAALNLPAVTSYADGLPVYFLTGKDFLYQTLFCIQSLTKATTTKFQYLLVDDGSFTPDIIAQINRQLPGALVITGDMIETNLQNALPPNRYPNIHGKRKIYPHLKKLTDIHTINSNQWKLVLDSDMLFWAEPVDLINWLKNPGTPLHMIDCVASYGYTEQLMEELSGSAIKPLINVGAIGLNSARINWDKLETWLATLEEKEGATYYLEQALTAMLIGDQPSIALSAVDYIVNPGKEMINQSKGVLHHYVDLSKEGYYKTAWRKLPPDLLKAHEC